MVGAASGLVREAGQVSLGQALDLLGADSPLLMPGGFIQRYIPHESRFIVVEDVGTGGHRYRGLFWGNYRARAP